jgi:hypothetical protein
VIVRDQHLSIAMHLLTDTRLSSSAHPMPARFNDASLEACSRRVPRAKAWAPCGLQRSAAAYSGPLIFSRLGLNVEKMFIPHQVALEQMRRGDVSAVVFVTSKPIDAFLKGRWDSGLKFLPVEYDAKFEDYYLPSSLEPPCRRQALRMNRPVQSDQQ